MRIIFKFYSLCYRPWNTYKELLIKSAVNSNNFAYVCTQNTKIPTSGQIDPKFVQ